MGLYRDYIRAYRGLGLEDFYKRFVAKDVPYNGEAHGKSNGTQNGNWAR